ncbi:MAG: 4'-phosphopantetheinyl transferase superfamily protein [Flavobacteriales bacterium]
MKAERSLIVHCEGPESAQFDRSSPGPIADAVPQVWFATLGSIQDREERYHKLLDEEELARAERFRFPKDRNRYILGHGLLRETLGHYLGLSAKELILRRGEFGKPFLEGNPVHFNLSDTKDAVLVAVAMEPIGADIETMTRSTDHERVAEHYFTASEVVSIAAATDGKRRFLELWTRKEAVLKACGVGIMDDLKSLNVGDKLNTMTIQHPDFVRLVSPEYHVRTLNVGNDHLVSIAASHPIAKLRLFEALPQ